MTPVILYGVLWNGTFSFVLWSLRFLFTVGEWAECFLSLLLPPENIKLEFSRETESKLVQR